MILVKPGDLVALQRGLELALQRYDEVVGRSRLAVRRKFSWERAMGEYFTLFSQYNGCKK